MPGRSVTAVMLAVAALVATADQATKATIVGAIGPGQPAGRVDLIGSWLSLEYAENRGVAFGLLSGAGGLVPLAPLLVLVVLVTRFLRSPVTPLEAFAIGAILGGALGNLIDRFRLGYVVDFIAVGAWPNFNIADSAITIGVGLLIWNWLAPGTERNAVWT